MSNKKQVDRAECPRCKEGTETFRYMRRMYVYDVDRARAMVGDGRPVVELDPDDVRSSVDECEIDDFHIPHVDPSIPGIIAHVRFRTPEGELLKGHVLIDGHHRAARCLQEDRPFYARLLSEDESATVLVRRPEDAYEPALAMA